MAKWMLILLSLLIIVSPVYSIIVNSAASGKVYTINVDFYKNGSTSLRGFDIINGGSNSERGEGEYTVKLLLQDNTVVFQGRIETPVFDFHGERVGPGGSLEEVIIRKDVVSQYIRISPVLDGVNKFQILKNDQVL